MAVDYKDKIRKLLALAESPVEAEAQAALLRARELMAKYKLTEHECREVEPQNVVRQHSNVTCSKRRDPWCIPLSAIIGENYCCKGLRTHQKKSQTQMVGFIGFEDDVLLCIDIFEYAVDCVHSEISRIKRRYAGYDADYIKRRCDSFGYGFVAGLSAAFDAQTAENKQEWGLVLVTPKEVQEAGAGLENPLRFVPARKIASSGTSTPAAIKAGRSSRCRNGLLRANSRLIVIFLENFSRNLLTKHIYRCIIEL